MSWDGAFHIDLKITLIGLTSDLWLWSGDKFVSSGSAVTFEYRNFYIFVEAANAFAFTTTSPHVQHFTKNDSKWLYDKDVLKKVWMRRFKWRILGLSKRKLVLGPLGPDVHIFFDSTVSQGAQLHKVVLSPGKVPNLTW